MLLYSYLVYLKHLVNPESFLEGGIKEWNFWPKTFEEGPEPELKIGTIIHYTTINNMLAINSRGHPLMEYTQQHILVDFQ